MNKKLLDNSVMLLLIFTLLQLGGQTAAGYAGREAASLNVFTLISYICLILRGLFWVLVLKKLPLTVAYPFTGGVYLLIIPLSILLFDEKPGWSRFVGALLIFCGIIFTAVGAVKNED